MAALLEPFGNCAEFLNSPVVQPLLLPAMDKSVSYVKNLTENDLKEKVGGMYYNEKTCMLDNWVCILAKWPFAWSLSLLAESRQCVWDVGQHEADLSASVARGRTEGRHMQTGDCPTYAESTTLQCKDECAERGVCVGGGWAWGDSQCGLLYIHIMYD